MTRWVNEEATLLEEYYKDLFEQFTFQEWVDYWRKFGCKATIETLCPECGEAFKYHERTKCYRKLVGKAIVYKGKNS